MPSLADESALLRDLDGLAAAGRYQDVLERIAALSAGTMAGRTPIALHAAQAHGRLGALDEAERCVALALESARAHGEPHAELRARNYQAAISLNRGHLDEAEAHFDAAVEMAGTLRDPASEARCLNNLGIIAFLRGNPKGALAAYHRALAAYQRAGLLRGLAETHHNIGISCRQLGDYRGALEAADQAARLSRQVQDDSLVGLVLTGRAEIHLALGDADLAEAELQAAEQAYKRVQFRTGLPEVWRVRAGVARARRGLPAAVQLLREAAELAATHGTAEVLSATERDLGDALEATGDAAGARAARERALAIFRRLGAADEIRALEVLLG